MRNVTFLSDATSVDFNVSFGVGRLGWNWAEARGEGSEHLAFAGRHAGNRLTVLALLLAAVAGEPEQLDDLVGGQQDSARA